MVRKVPLKNIIFGLFNFVQIPLQAFIFGRITGKLPLGIVAEKGNILYRNMFFLFDSLLANKGNKTKITKN